MVMVMVMVVIIDLDELDQGFISDSLGAVRFAFLGTSLSIVSLAVSLLRLQAVFYDLKN